MQADGCKLLPTFLSLFNFKKCRAFQLRKDCFVAELNSMISHKKIQVTVCTCKPFSHPFRLCAHSLCQGTNVLESPEYCVEIFLFAEQSVQYTTYQLWQAVLVNLKWESVKASYLFSAITNNIASATHGMDWVDHICRICVARAFD